ncbi:hypothetical protein ACQ4PT_066055 [Festuca glaucescens]
MGPRGELSFSIAGKRRCSPEFPCVSRFRQRWLISFLAHHSFYRTVDVFVTQTDVLMCMKHLLNLVEAGLWGDTIEYLSRFLPSDRRLGIHGRALFHFLRVHQAIERKVWKLVSRVKRIWLSLPLTKVQLFTNMAGISELQRISVYADDVIIFCKPVRAELASVKAILQMFGDASGLCVNYRKTSATLIRGQEGDAERITEVLGCEMTEFPIKYLGMQLALTPLTKAEWQPMIDKVIHCVPA